jgi:hypothetical protein
VRLCWIPRFVIGTIFALSYTAAASDLSGKITIEKKIVKKTVAATVYQLRGLPLAESVPDRQTSNEFEKIAVWLESPAAPPSSPIANPHGLFSDSQHPQWTAGGGYTFAHGLHLGVSGFSGPYLDNSVKPLLAINTNLQSFGATAFGVDAN